MRKITTASLVAASVAATLVLAGCGPDRGAACSAPSYERAALDVDVVVSAEFECGGDFGNKYETGTVVLAVDTQEEANPVIENVYRSFAASPDLVDARLSPVEFVSESTETRFDDHDLGFNGAPSLRQMREKYGITPTPTP